MILVFFKTPLTGDAIFQIGWDLRVWRIGAYEGAVANAIGWWRARDIELVEVTPDVARWLNALP